jgi:hypothetical protein
MQKRAHPCTPGKILFSSPGHHSEDLDGLPQPGVPRQYNHPLKHLPGFSPILTGAFLGAGLPACVIIPGLLVMGDRVFDHMEDKK